MTGSTKIARGTFYGRSTVQGYPFAIGVLALTSNGVSAVNMNSLLASGSTWANPFYTVYYNGQSTVSWYPSIMTNTAVSYAQVVTVNGTVGEQKSGAVLAPTLKSMKAGKKKATAKWDKISGATKYQLRYSTKKNMKGAKTVDVSKKSASKTVKKLKRGKRYYMQVRTFKDIGGLTYYSAWSNKKNVVVS